MPIQRLIHLHFLVGNPFPPVFLLRLSIKITSCHTPCRCPNFSRQPTSLNPHFRCKIILAIFSEIISAVIVQYFSFSDAAKRTLSKAEPIPCLCFSCLTCTLTSATPTYPQVLDTGLSVAQPKTIFPSRATNRQDDRRLESQSLQFGGLVSKEATPVLMLSA